VIDKLEIKNGKVACPYLHIDREVRLACAGCPFAWRKLKTYIACNFKDAVKYKDGRKVYR